jgi:small subunit ribosomal protein S6e
MANFKLVIADPKSRKAYQREVDQGKSGLLGKAIGEKLKGDNLGLPGYELQLTGGSDRDGFPMRPDVKGVGRKRILLAFGPGFHPVVKGQRRRKSVRGNTISTAITQVNIKVLKHGPKSLEGLFGKEKAEKKEKPKEEARPEEKPGKEEPAKEKPEDKPEAEKAEEGKAEPKEEAKAAPESAKAEEKMGVKELEKSEEKKEK